MKVGDSVWVFDESRRIYREGQSSPIYREHFEEKYIIGETKQSWLIGNTINTNLVSFKANKKTLCYKDWYRIERKIFTDLEAVNQDCWIHENRYNISSMVLKCNDYDKLVRIKAILDEKE